MAFLELEERAVPFLSRVVRSQPSALGRSYRVTVSRLPAPLQAWLPRSRQDEDYRLRQRQALVLLGFLAYWKDRERPWGKPQTKVSAGSILPAIRVGLRDSDAMVRSTAAHAAACLGAEAAPLVSELTRLVAETNEVARLSAVMALGHIGPGASNAVPALATFLHGANLVEHQVATMALGRIGAPARSAGTTLVRALDAPETDTRHLAARALYQIGRTPPEAVPGLRRLTNQPNPAGLRQAAALALWNLDRHDPAALAAVSNLIAQAPLAGLLELNSASLDETASSLVPLLSTFTNHPQPLVRLKAALALSDITRVKP
jgi:HEAT repeat protein